MKPAEIKVDTAWRKSRLAASLLIRKESRPLRPREQALARQLSQDSEMTNRLIQQAFPKCFRAIRFPQFWPCEHAWLDSLE